ncbi:adenine phosphoribosyltransferase 1, chloroplastic [Artemisia annua]|uniref:adenine phosphoribosyltransferase n=1 Tax=Artemisia annua TaxID=35608 RepID=A0A2U1NRN6_ARTAN|nr:adenine phosphoribosyltransferase 1, chloroplastic [Artemisia annua]
MRKPNKLPGAVISEEYSLEYGTYTMEMHVGAVQAGERALVIDDLIAIVGTLAAAIKLLERVEANIVECACVIELADLKKSMSSVDTYAVQCNNCFQWRTIPTVEEFEEYRSKPTKDPFFCTKLEGIVYASPTDIEYNASQIWVLDIPSTQKTPKGF